METKLPHERLDVYRVYLETAGLCGDVVTNAAIIAWWETIREY